MCASVSGGGGRGRGESHVDCLLSMDSDVVGAGRSISCP